MSPVTLLLAHHRLIEDDASGQLEDAPATPANVNNEELVNRRMFE